MELYWNLQKCISGFFSSAFEFISQQTLVFMKTSSSSEDVFKTSSSRQIYSHYSYIFRKRAQDILKTSWSRQIYSSWSYVFKTSSRRLQDILQKRFQDIYKTSWRCLEDVLKTFLQDVFARRLAKTFSRRLQNVFKTSCKNVFKTSSRHLQNVFKTYHQVKLFLITRFQDVFGTYSKHFWDVLQRRLSIEGFAYVTLLRNLRSVYKICKSDKSFSNFSFSLC